MDLQCGMMSMWVLKLFLPGKKFFFFFFFRFVFRPDKKGSNSLLLRLSLQRKLWKGRNPQANNKTRGLQVPLSAGWVDALCPLWETEFPSQPETSYTHRKKVEEVFSLLRAEDDVRVPERYLNIEWDEAKGKVSKLQSRVSFQVSVLLSLAEEADQFTPKSHW